jgi:P-type E1-E2 ATPase
VIELSIPGLGTYHIQHLVLDVNGTVARDGVLIDGIAERIAELQELLAIHLLTADTYGGQATIDEALGLTATRIATGHESAQKGRYVRHLGASSVIAVGNGANDVEMLQSAAVGIAVIGSEGLAGSALLVADVLVRDPADALDLLRFPKRLAATLRR